MLVIFIRVHSGCDFGVVGEIGQEWRKEVLDREQLKSLNEKKLEPNLGCNSARKDEVQFQPLKICSLVFYSLPYELTDEIPDYLDDEVSAENAKPAPDFI